MQIQYKAERVPNDLWSLVRVEPRKVLIDEETYGVVHGVLAALEHGSSGVGELDEVADAIRKVDAAR